MKLTDFALIFVAILLPIVIIVYVNTSFVVKSEKQEMYYKNIMNSAVSDAVSSMKHVENNDSDIDYGYSGIVDKKVSINATTAIDTFYSSLASNFNIKDNEISLERLKMYIPVIAVLDYDGIYIHSAEVDETGSISFTTKPKVNYTYSYVLTKAEVAGETSYGIQEIDENTDINSIINKLLSRCIYEITFTMDDYVYLNIYQIKNDVGIYKIGDVLVSTKFYLTDSVNNEDLVYASYNILLSDKKDLKQSIVEKLSNERQNVIARVGMEEVSYAVNKHNDYSKSAGINYTFRFSVESDEAWYETMDGIGMIAIIQGVSLGNRYLNYKAYSASDLVMATRYYVSEGIEDPEGNYAYFSRNLYHVSKGCEVYEEYLKAVEDQLIPVYYSRKAEAAKQGFYPCPICKP